MTDRFNLEYQVSQLFRLKMEEFVAWCADNWTVTPEQAIHDNVFDGKPPGYREGYNHAVQNLAGALECFLEDRT